VTELKAVKVLLIANDLDLGGSNRYCLELMAALTQSAPKDLDVTLLALGAPPPAEQTTWLWAEARAMNVPLHVVPMNSPFDFGVLKRLRPWLPRSGPVIVHTQEYRGNLIGRLLKLIKPSVIHVSTKHGFVLTSEWRSRFYVMLDRLTLRLSDHYIAVCRDTAQRLLRDWRLPERNVSIIYNGLAAARSAGGDSWPALVARVDRPFCIGFVGRLITGKGVGDLIEAFRLAIAQAPQLRLIIAGDGPQRAEFEAQARDLPITFLGTINVPERVYRDLDVLVLCSHPASSEAFPFVVLESMRARVPVIATRVGGLAELIEDGQTGLLVEPEQPAALAQAILTLAQDAELRARLTDAAEHQVQTRFSAQVMARQTANLYIQQVKDRT
jgi:glycosyltransferase involved in cell wall biosynthesis